MDQALSPQVEAPRPTREEAPAKPETTPQPYGNAAQQEQVAGAGATGDPGLANYKATLGEYLGGELYKAVSGALSYDKVQGYAKSAVDSAISAAVAQLGGWDRIKADQAALDALATMIQQQIEPMVETWLASEDGRALVARLQGWAGAHPKTVVATAILAAAGAILANADVPSLKSSFKIGSNLTAEVEADIGRIRDLTLQKVRGKLAYQSGGLLAAVEVTRNETGGVEGTANVELKDGGNSVALNGTFDGDGLKVAGLRGVLGIRDGMDLSGNLSSERGRSGVLSTLSLVDKDGRLTRTNDFTFDSGSGVLTLGQSVLADLGNGLSFRSASKLGSDNTGSQSLGVTLTRDDLKAQLDAAFGTTGTTVSGSVSTKNKQGYTAAGDVSLKDGSLLQLGTSFGFKDPDEFRGWLVSYRRNNEIDENQFKLTLENHLGDLRMRMAGDYTQGTTGGTLNASFHAAKPFNDNTMGVAGLNYTRNLGTGQDNFVPEVGVQHRGVQVLFGYDPQNKAGTIRLGIPF